MYQTFWCFNKRKTCSIIFSQTRFRKGFNLKDLKGITIINSLTAIHYKAVSGEVLSETNVIPKLNLLLGLPNRDNK